MTQDILKKWDGQEALYVYRTSSVQHSVQKTMSMERIHMSVQFSVLKVGEMKTPINYECRNNENFLEVIFHLTTAPAFCEHRKSIA